MEGWMPKLLLINPSTTHSGLGNIRATAWPPLNLPYLAAVTPSHYQIEVVDENIEPFTYRDADIVGITAFTSSVHRGYQISRIYREKGIPTVMGGIHVSMMPEEALQYCDVVVIGEAEGVWPKVLGDFEAGRLQKQYRGTWADLDSLPIPRRDILRNEYYRWGSLQTSRGCPMNCAFCSVTAFNGRRFRRRPLEDVMTELESIPQKRVLLTDDNVIGYGKRDLAWTRAFFERILEKGMKKTFLAQASIQLGEDPQLLQLAARAGLRIVFVGVESINPEALSSYGKGVNLDRLQQARYSELIAAIRKAGIVFLGAFVLGGDEDDRSVFPATLEFIRASRIDVLQVTKPTPLPGTQLWDSLERDGRIIDSDFPGDWDNYSLSRLVYKPRQMTIEEVYEGSTYLRCVYYSFWETVKRTLFTFLSTKSFVTTFIAYRLNASYRKPFRASAHYRKYRHRESKGRFLP